MKLTDNGLVLSEKEIEVLKYVKETGRVSVATMAADLGRTEKSVGANITGLAGGAKLKDHALVAREKEEGPDGKQITFVVLTDEGKSFDIAD